MIKLTEVYGKGITPGEGSDREPTRAELYLLLEKAFRGYSITTGGHHVAVHKLGSTDRILMFEGEGKDWQ